MQSADRRDQSKARQGKGKGGHKGKRSGRSEGKSNGRRKGKPRARARAGVPSGAEQSPRKCPDSKCRQIRGYRKLLRSFNTFTLQKSFSGDQNETFPLRNGRAERGGAEHSGPERGRAG